MDKTTDLKAFIERIFRAEKKKPGAVNFVFCSDAYLLKMNRKYLGHHYYTDILTFEYKNSPKVVADIFISIDRVRENAKTYKTSFRCELLRVIFHGVLHLCGYTDKSPKDQLRMREKENFYLNKYLANQEKVSRETRRPNE